MSTSFIYHAFGIRDYFYKAAHFIGGGIIFDIFPKPEAIKCPKCNSRSVIKRGKIVRSFRGIPIGSKPVTIRADIQRVWCSICNFVRQIKLSFSKEGKSYTRAFERYALELSQFMTIQDIADHLRISWDTIKQIQKSHLQRRYKTIPLKEVRQIAIDEISIGKGHQYLTIVMDLETGRILHAGDGKGGDALKSFWKKVKTSKATIEAISIDMSPAYLSSVMENMPNSTIVFDRFHVVKLFNDKLSKFRRDLHKHLSDKKDHDLIKGTRWLLLKNPENLQKSKGEEEQLQKALKINQPLSTVYYMKEELRQIWSQSDKKTGEKIINNWINLANASDIPMLQNLPRRWHYIRSESFHIMTIQFQRAHWRGPITR